MEDYETHLYGDRFADVYDEEDGAEAGEIEASFRAAEPAPAV